MREDSSAYVYQALLKWLSLNKYRDMLNYMVCFNYYYYYYYYYFVHLVSSKGVS